MQYEKLIKTFKEVWPVLLPLIPKDHFIKVIDDEFTVEHIRFGSNDSTSILRFYGNGGTRFSDIIMELSFNTETKYFSTITEKSIRIATWKLDFPRYYAMRDDSNGKNGDDYTYIEWPCDTDYFFQRMTVQNTLEHEQYEELDIECMVMQEFIAQTSHEAKSIAIVLNDYDISTDKIIELIKGVLDGKIEAVSGNGVQDFKGL